MYGEGHAVFRGFLKELGVMQDDVGTDYGLGHIEEPFGLYNAAQIKTLDRAHPLLRVALHIVGMGNRAIGPAIFLLPLSFPLIGVEITVLGKLLHDAIEVASQGFYLSSVV